MHHTALYDRLHSRIDHDHDPKNPDGIRECRDDRRDGRELPEPHDDPHDICDGGHVS